MSQTDHRHAPIELWRTAQTFLGLLFNLFGNPEDVAERHTLTKKPYKLLLDWLRAGEALLRRLLLIEASAHPKPNTRPLLRAQRKRTRTLRYFTPEEPEKWRVSFRTFASPVAGPAKRPRSRSEKRFFSAWPLAERYEALIRVFINPAPFAARLARRLFATPHRQRELTSHPANAPDLIGGIAFAATDAPCADAARHFEPG
jgi:hypothetical protein